MRWGLGEGKMEAESEPGAADIDVVPLKASCPSAVDVSGSGATCPQGQQHQQISSEDRE